MHIENVAFEVKNLAGLLKCTGDVIKTIELYQIATMGVGGSIVRFFCKKGKYDLTIRGVDPGMGIQINPDGTSKSSALTDIVEGLVIENLEGEVFSNAILSKCDIKCRGFRRTVSSPIYYPGRICRQTTVDAQSVALVCMWSNVKEQLRPIAFLTNMCDRTTPDELYSKDSGIYNSDNYTRDKFDHIAQLLSLHLPDDILERCGIIMPHKVNYIYMSFTGFISNPEESRKKIVNICISTNDALNYDMVKSPHTISQKCCNNRLNIAYRL